MYVRAPQDRDATNKLLTVEITVMLTVANTYTRGSKVSAVHTLLLRVNITYVGTLRHEERN